MSQSKVTAYYNTRKKRPDIKNNLPKQDKSKALTFASFFSELQDEQVSLSTLSDSSKSEIKSDESKSKLEKTIRTPKSQIKATRKARGKNANFTDIKTDIRSAFEIQKGKIEVTNDEATTVVKSSSEDVDEIVLNLSEVQQTPKKDPSNLQEYDSSLTCTPKSLLRTPKRHSPSSISECGSNSKKKKLGYASLNVTPTVYSSPLGESSEKHASVRKKLVLTDGIPKGDLSSSINECFSDSKKKRPGYASQNVTPTVCSSPLAGETDEKHASVRRKLILTDAPSPVISLKETFKSPKKLDFKLKLPHHSKSEKSEDIDNEKLQSSSTSSPLSTPTKIAEDIVPLETKFILPAGVSSLPLPAKYKQLNDIFRCSEFIVSNCHNRKQVCTFSLLKQRVQEMRKKAFTEKNLGQIKTVYPSAYNYAVEKTIAAIANRNPNAPPHNLVISLNMTTISTALAGSPVKKSPLKLNVPPCSPSNMRISSDLITRRQKTFFSSLMSIVMKHHEDFLSNMNPPLHVSPLKLFKWHPKFSLDSVPEIEVSDLPKLPEKPKVCSAQDLLKKFSEIKCGAVFEKALHSVVDQSSKITPTKQVAPTPQNTPNSSPQTTPKTKFQEVLERIRAKTAEKMLKEMTTTPEEEKRKRMLEYVPELVRTLRTYFLAEKKTTLPFETVIVKMTESAKTMIGRDIIEEHLRLMLQLFPDWISLSTLPKKGSFMKMDKTKDTNIMLKNMPKC